MRLSRGGRRIRIGVDSCSALGRCASPVQASRLVLLLTRVSALTYALNQLLTRKLGCIARLGLSVYIRGSSLCVSLGFFLLAGDRQLCHDRQVRRRWCFCCAPGFGLRR